MAGDRKKLMLQELEPGPLPGYPISWRAWKIAGHIDRRRLEGPRELSKPVRTAYAARHAAAIECWPGWDPLAIEVEPILPAPKASRKNGASK